MSSTYVPSEKRDAIMDSCIKHQQDQLKTLNDHGLLMELGEVVKNIHDGVQKHPNVLKETFQNINGSVAYQEYSEDEKRGALKILYWIKNELDWEELPV